MSAHTPGPCLKCQIVTERIPAELRERTGTSDEYRRVILYCPTHAAAPDLLAALEEMSKRYGWHGASVGAHPTVITSTRRIRKAGA